MSARAHILNILILQRLFHVLEQRCHKEMALLKDAIQNRNQ